MTTTDINKIPKEFASFIGKINTGETVLIVQEGNPIAEIKPVARRVGRDLRPIGLCAGEFIVPDDFDDPLPEEIIAGFERSCIISDGRYIGLGSLHHWLHQELEFGMALPDPDSYFMALCGMTQRMWRAIGN